VQDVLEQLTSTPGVIIVRGDDFWEFLNPGNNGDVVMMASGKPQWQPNLAAERVTRGFAATLAADQTGLTTSAFNLAKFATELFDKGSYYNNATGQYKWTPPAGLIQLNAHVLMSAGASIGDFAEIMIFKNGAQFYGTLLTCAQANFAGGALVVNDYCNGTDYYQCYVFPPAGAGNIRQIYNNNLTHFSGVWLGP
jgi:hypothetical protein